MTQPTPAEQLLNLADRAERHGGLTASEAARLRSGLIVLSQRLKAARDLCSSLGAQLTEAEAAIERARKLATDWADPKYRGQRGLPPVLAADALRDALDPQEQ